MILLNPQSQLFWLINKCFYRTQKCFNIRQMVVDDIMQFLCVNISVMMHEQVSQFRNRYKSFLCEGLIYNSHLAKLGSDFAIFHRSSAWQTRKNVRSDV